MILRTIPFKCVCLESFCRPNKWKINNNTTTSQRWKERWKWIKWMLDNAWIMFLFLSFYHFYLSCIMYLANEQDESILRQFVKKSNCIHGPFYVDEYLVSKKILIQQQQTANSNRSRFVAIFFSLLLLSSSFFLPVPKFSCSLSLSFARLNLKLLMLVANLFVIVINLIWSRSFSVVVVVVVNLFPKWWNDGIKIGKNIEEETDKIEHFATSFF